jgi:hypothetical protein
VNSMEAYRRAQDGFDAILAAVPAEKWDRPSACALWTLRDVAGHIIWGQEQLLGDQPLASIINLSITDHLAHAWDIGYALALDIRLDTDLVAGSPAWARDNIVRVPGFFGPELSPPLDADEQTRWLAYLGRAAWQPVPSLATMSELNWGPGR